ncbi:MAG: EAL domain-containing protein [Planctomycetes bacterium]|nr:EAL domain-containing protein [Planctomycetota bacterium]
MNRFRPLRSPSLQIALAYAVLAGAWIASSDDWVEKLSRDSETLAALQHWKGLGFVLVTAALLYALVRSYERRVVRRDQHLRENTRQYRELVLASPEPMFVFAADTLEFLEVNAACARQYGWSREELLRMTVADIRPPADVARLREHLSTAAESAHRSGDWRHLRRDGSTFDVEVTSHALQFAGRPARFVIAHDVTSERETARRLARLSSLYAASFRTSQTMVRLRERSQAFPELCGLVVEAGGLRGAEVRLWDARRERMERSAGSGSVPDGAAGPLPREWSDGCSHVIGDLLAEAPDLAASERRSAAVLPLREHGEVIGVLLVYSDEPAWFDTDVRSLLEEIAVDFSFTLDRLRADASRAATDSALAESEERFRHLLHSVSDVAWSSTLDGSKLLYVNARVEEVYGRTQRELYQDPGLWLDVIHPEDRERVRSENRELLRLGRSDCEYRIVRPDGSERWIHSRTAVVHDIEGRALRLGGLCSEFTARKQAEHQLELAAVVFERSRESIVLTDERARILAVNPAFTRLFGYREDEVRGQTPSVIRSGRHDAEFYASLWAALREHGHWQGELVDRAKDGSLHPQWTSITAVRSREGALRHYIAIASDLTERRRAEARIQELAWFDSLTGLPNRALLRVRADAALGARATREDGFALLHIGLDEFGSVNESLGHGQGDQVLFEVARRIAAAVPTGSIVARVDGDEFAVWLSTAVQERVLAIAADLRAALRVPLHVGTREIAVTGSVGISCALRDGDDFDTLLRHAAAALSRAKSRARDACEFFQPALSEAVNEQLDVECALRFALERGELELHYQPQVELASGALVGLEALVRWQRPGVGLVPPSKFVAIAERCGLIVPIGSWVLREACRQLRAWRDAGLAPVRVAVNLSAAQLAREDLVETVLGALRAARLEPDALELEITESMLSGESEEVPCRVDELVRHGVEIALDDFGTGYSNLQYLRRFPLHRLKIDRTFVAHLGQDDYDRAIARAIVAVGDALRLRVIAEGVERLEQVHVLRELGCTQGQGFLFARPLPAGDVLSWVRLNAQPSLVERTPGSIAAPVDARADSRPS